MKLATPSPEADRIYVSIVYHNSLTQHTRTVLEKTFQALIAQEGFVLGQNLFVRLCDNSSDDQNYALLQEFVVGKDIYLQRNEHNLGFSAAHNQSVFKFLNSNCNYLLILNPDLALAPNALRQMLEGFKKYPEAGLLASKLYRGNHLLEKSDPPCLDSAGMILNNSLRHFDRGSDQIDQGHFDHEEYVFGVTGACMMLTRPAVKALVLPRNKAQSDLYRLYPQLLDGINERHELFDESFFAYREDADLCWRALNFGIKTVYLPQVQGIHRRVVLSTNRQQLKPELNYLSVRNRFLLQINNYSIRKMPSAFFPGIIFRNLLVLLACIIQERTSLKAFRDLGILFRRAYLNRCYILKQGQK